MIKCLASAAVGAAVLGSVVAAEPAAAAPAAEYGAAVRISTPMGGGQGNGRSYQTTLSGSGRKAAFVTAATNLTGADRNGTVEDVLVRDLDVGGLQRASVSGGEVQANGDSQGASLDWAGNRVAFTSSATNLAGTDRNGTPGDFAAQDVFVRDLRAGTTTRVSASSGGVAGNNFSYTPDLSGNGRYVAFASAATDLVPGDTNGQLDVFVRDLQTGTTERISVSTDGRSGNGRSDAPSISGDGRYVAFTSQARNLVLGDTNAVADVFVRDRTAGTTRRVSVSASGGQADGRSAVAALSNDGQVVAMTTQTINLGPGDGTGERTRTDLIVKDLRNGAVRVVAGPTFSQSLTADGGTLLRAAERPSGTLDLLVQDLATGERDTVNRLAGGGYAGDSSFASSALSADGTVLTWDSSVNGIVADDTNFDYDVFITRSVS